MKNIFLLRNRCLPSVVFYVHMFFDLYISRMYIICRYNTSLILSSTSFLSKWFYWYSNEIFFFFFLITCFCPADRWHVLIIDFFHPPVWVAGGAPCGWESALFWSIPRRIDSWADYYGDSWLSGTRGVGNFLFVFLVMKNVIFCGSLGV